MFVVETDGSLYLVEIRQEVKWKDKAESKGSCKPWNGLTTNNDLTTNNELSNYSIELSVQMGVSTGPLSVRNGQIKTLPQKTELSSKSNEINVSP